MSKKVIYKVTGERTIHCNGCENTINLALKQLPEVGVASADRVSQMIEVTLASDDSDTQPITMQLDSLGYQVEAV